MANENEEDLCKGTIPLTKWLEEEPENEDVCRPCTLSLLTGWYHSEMEETGRMQQARALTSFLQKPDLKPEEVAEKLDWIKEETRKSDPEFASRLREFDCTVQRGEDEVF